MIMNFITKAPTDCTAQTIIPRNSHESHYQHPQDTNMSDDISMYVSSLPFVVSWCVPDGCCTAWS